MVDDQPLDFDNLVRGLLNSRISFDSKEAAEAVLQLLRKGEGHVVLEPNKQWRIQDYGGKYLLAYTEEDSEGIDLTDNPEP